MTQTCSEHGSNMVHTCCQQPPWEPTKYQKTVFFWMEEGRKGAEIHFQVHIFRMINLQRSVNLFKDTSGEKEKEMHYLYCHSPNQPIQSWDIHQQQKLLMHFQVVQEDNLWCATLFIFLLKDTNIWVTLRNRFTDLIQNYVLFDWNPKCSATYQK